jgi:hypothetical protein
MVGSPSPRSLLPSDVEATVAASVKFSAGAAVWSNLSGAAAVHSYIVVLLLQNCVLRKVKASRQQLSSRQVQRSKINLIGGGPGAAQVLAIG